MTKTKGKSTKNKDNKWKEIPVAKPDHLVKRRNKNLSRLRKTATKINIKESLDHSQLGVKKKPRKRAKVKETKKSDQSRQTHQTTQNSEKPKINHLPTSSPDPCGRRMASLNAEAVNNLLFREDPKSSRKTQHPKIKSTATERKEQTSNKNPKSQDLSATQDQTPDWMSMFAPTPRRQAALTAASLLKLTAAQYRKWRRKEDPDETEGATQRRKYQRTRQRRGPLGCSAQTGKSECGLKENSQVQSPTPRLFLQVKEEEVEKRRESYSCSQEQCVHRCHRLALFLPDHHHHHPHHLTALTPDSYTCFPGYYLHLCHPSVTTQEEGVSSRKSSKASGTSHPVYCCTSVGPCFDPATICYSSGTPAVCHVCCSQCIHGVKKEEFPSAVSDIPSPSHLMCPRILTACPTPQVPPAPPFETRPPSVAPLPLPHTCPQTTQASRAPHTCPQTTQASRAPHTCPQSTQASRAPHICPQSTQASRAPHICPQSTQASRAPHTCPQSTQASRAPHICSKSTQASRAPHTCPQSTQASRAPHTCPQSIQASRAPHTCPQTTQASRAPQTCSTSVRDRRNPPSVVSEAKKRHQRSTNGWQPVGQSFQKEVFTVGEETPVWRTCFEAVQRDEEVVQVRDTVLLKSGSRKKSLPYVAKVSALWEDPDSGELMMSLFWYYRPEHTQGGRRPNVHCENEVFASRHQDVNSVACIEDKCYVLTLAQYCRFRAFLKRQREGVGFRAASVVPPAVERSLHTLDPQLVFYCGHVYDYRYGRLLKNLQ